MIYLRKRVVISMRTSSFLTSALVLALIFTALPSTSFIHGETTLPRDMVFGTDVKVSDDQDYYNNQKEAELAVGSDGTVYATWADPRNGDHDIYFASSFGNSTFSINLRVDDSQTSTNSQNPDIAVSTDGNIYIVWEDFRNGNWDIYLSRSASGGSNWITNIPVNDISLTSEQRYPKIATAPNGNIFVAWDDSRTGINDHEIYVARSTDGGLTFSDGTAVGDMTGGHRQHPDLEVDPQGRPCVVWEDFRGYDYPFQSENSIYFATSSDGANSFTTNVRVDDDASQISSSKRFPDLAIGPGGDVYIVWADRRGGNNNVYFCRSYDGVDFSSEIMVNDLEGACHPDSIHKISCDGIGNLYVVWVDSRDGNHTFLSRSPDGGTTFEPPSPVDDTQHSVLPPDMAELLKANPDILTMPFGLYCIWEDYRNDPAFSNGIPENSDIYFDHAALASDETPFAPTPQVSDLGWDHIGLEWEPCPASDFSYYELFFSTIAGFIPDAGNLYETIHGKTDTMRDIASIGSNTTYYFRLRVTDTGGNKNTSSEVHITTLANQPPEITLTEPIGNNDVADEAFLITWTDDDPEENATIILAYDLDRMAGGTTDIIRVPEGEDGELDSYSWSTSDLPENFYYIVATIDDGHSSLISVWSKGHVQVSHAAPDVDSTPPSISSTAPPDGAQDIPVDTRIYVVLSEDVLDESISPSVIAVPSGDEVPLVWNYWQGNRTINIEPDVHLESATLYRATVSAGLEDLFDNIMSQDYSWTFLTEVPEDWAALTIKLNESNTGAPIQGAQVVVTASGYTFTGSTDSSGSWIVSVPPGPVEVSVDKPGYSTTDPFYLTIEAGGSKMIHFTKTSFDLNHAPHILSIIGRSPVKVKENINFKVSANDQDEDPIQYRWDFGDDGATARGDDTWHKFSSAGTYIVICNASDGKGKWDLGDITIVVEEEKEDEGSWGYLIFALIGGLIFVLVLVTLYSVRNRSRHKETLEEREEERLQLEDVEVWKDDGPKKQARRSHRLRELDESVVITELDEEEVESKNRRRSRRKGRGARPDGPRADGKSIGEREGKKKKKGPRPVSKEGRKTKGKRPLKKRKEPASEDEELEVF